MSRRLRSAGRAVGVGTAALWVFVLIASAVGDADPAVEEDPALVESVLIVVLAVANIGALGLAWFRERTGSLVLMATAVAFGIFGYWSAGRNEWFAALVGGGPFLLSGLMLWLAQRRSAAATDRAGPTPAPSHRTPP